MRVPIVVGFAVGLLIADFGCQRIVTNGGITLTNNAKVMKEKKEHESFKTGASPHILVDLFMGPIIVEGSEGSTVEVDLTVRGGGDTEADAQAMLQKLTTSIEQSGKDGNDIEVKASIPSGQQFVGDARATLKVPADARLSLRTSFGDVKSTGVKGAIDAHSANGAIVLRDAAGPVKLKTSFGAIEVHGAARDVNATTSNGKILIEGAKGPLQLKSSFGDIVVNTAGGEINAESSNGKIQIHGATGRVVAKTSFGDIDIHADQAHVTANTSNGSMNFAGSLAEGASEFQNSFGSITVHLPGDAQFALDARTSFGTVTCGFELAKTTTRSSDHVVGQVGEKPASQLRLTTSNGSIVIGPAAQKRAQ